MSHMSYKKLWKLLIDKDMNKTQLMEAAGISNSSMSRLHKGENFNTDTLIKICDTLGCDIGDVCEVIKQEEN